jgi:hypothetical protein
LKNAGQIFGRDSDVLYLAAVPFAIEGDVDLGDAVKGECGEYNPPVLRCRFSLRCFVTLPAQHIVSGGCFGRDRDA